jgi:hypothetical protein
MASPASGPEVPPGLTTLRMWAARHGRTYNHVRQYWGGLPGFPEPVGKLEPAEQRRGRRESLFDEAVLDAWLAARPELAPPERIESFPVDLDERITLGRFASLIGKANKTVSQHRGRPGFPESDGDGLYRASDLLEYWNRRPGRRESGLLATSPHDDPVAGLCGDAPEGLDEDPSTDCEW